CAPDPHVQAMFWTDAVAGHRGLADDRWVMSAKLLAMSTFPSRTNQRLSRRVRQTLAPPHSHSIVPGGLLVTSYTTRFTPFTSLMMRVAVSAKNFMSNW